MVAESLKDLAKAMRVDILQMIAKAGSGHPGGSLSSIDILCALFLGGVMHYNPKDAANPNRDRFILAKGHGAPALYAVLAQAGYFPRKELAGLRQLGSRLQGHPDSTLLPGVEVSTGSLGQGLSIACGIGCGLKLEENSHSVFALLGDGECQEGQVWEAAMFAAHQGLDNLVAIVDRNELQIDGAVKDVCDLGDLGAKFESFGWDVQHADGHDIESLVEVLNEAKAKRAGKPKVIIARTIKGKGVDFMEGNAGWHGKAPSAEELKQALECLGASLNDEPEIWGETEVVDRATAPKKDAASSAVSTGAQAAAPKLWQGAEGEVAPKKATRAALGATLAALSEEGTKIVAVDADLTGSTTLKAFASAAPENAKRLFNAGIAEQNMTDVAAGLSLTGNVAFTGSFAVFGTGRAYDQIRNTICYSNLNVKITPTHAGISVGPDGGSHQMLEDISLMRTLPRMQVLVPADYPSAVSALRIAANTPGPVYVRLGRESLPQIYSDDVQLSLGGAYVLREGASVTIAACGVEVAEALKAADILAEKGISAEVIDVFSIKPLDCATILKSVEKTGRVVVAEEHSVHGGLGSAIAELLAEKHPAPMAFIGMKDAFGKSGDYRDLAEYFSMDAKAIVAAAKTLL